MVSLFQMHLKNGRKNNLDFKLKKGVILIWVVLIATSLKKKIYKKIPKPFYFLQRLCLDGKHNIEDIHNSSLGRITSLAYDWKGYNIYWIDEEFKSLEVSKPNGLYRRELLRGSQFFDKPRALLLDAHHG